MNGSFNICLRCTHPNIPRPMGLIEQQAILSSPAEDQDGDHAAAVGGQEGSEGPVAPTPRTSEEWSKVETLEEMTNR